MDWIASTLAEFGRQIGIDNLQADDEGRLSLQFESGGQLSIEQIERSGQDELLIFWMTPVGYQAGTWVRAALVRCHDEGLTAWPVQVGLRGSGPDTMGLLLVRTPARGFTPQTLGQAVEHMSRWVTTLRSVS